MGKRLPLGLFEGVIIHRLEIPQLSEILDAFQVPSGQWKELVMAEIKSVRVALNRLRKGLDKFAVDEEERKRLLSEREQLLKDKQEYTDAEVIEDAEAAAYRLRSEADIANLKAEIAELKARKTLSPAEETELAEMIEELASKVGLPPEPSEETDTESESEEDDTDEETDTLPDPE